MARPPFLLDVSETVPAPTGYEAVATEAEFLALATGSQPLLVQGRALCQWAREFCLGRDFPWEQVRPALEWLQLHCRTLTDAQARRVLEMLADCGRLHLESYRARDVMEALFDHGPWSERPGPAHAARWLLWLEEHALDPALGPLLAQIAGGWVQDSPEGIASLYALHDGTAARGALAAWLGVVAAGPERAAWGDFPLAVPARWHDQARNIWSEESIVERPRLLERVRARRALHEIQKEAAQVMAEYFPHHVDQLTAPVLAALEPFLSEESVSQLRVLCPPDLPDPLPEDIIGVLDWFVEQYLPFRVWEQEHGDEAAHEVASDRATEFETWCLQFYPKALAGGAGSEHLAIRWSQRLQQSRSESVTLWVVFDGLTYPDGQALARMLAEEPRLSLVSLTPALSPLPTITDFCKRPLIEGLPFGSIDSAKPYPSWDGARLLKESREANEALAQARLGDVFIWSLTQPDKTYHEKADAPTIRRGVQSELLEWAKRIRDGAKAVPAHLPLRVIFTTDHGRLLSAGARTLDVPAGMEAHGRAAYGPSGRNFDATGTDRDDAAGLVYLDKDRFRLPMDCAVALGSRVFKMSDGKTGQEWFPHGGLSPEEVLIPWGELTRDLAPPRLRASVSGQGRSGAAHPAQVHLENLGAVPVRAVALVLVVGGEAGTLPLDGVEVGPQSSVDVSVEVTRWPNGQQAEGARATVECALPGGSRITVEANVNLKAQQMQSSRDADLLGDLM